MVDIYRSSCSSCRSFFELKYGSKSKDIAYEIYSCPQCKNMFSIPNNGKELLCPNCGNIELNQYNMNKEKNIRYYKKMMREGLLTPQKYNTLVSYWNNVESDKCPKCENKTLIWRCFEKII